MKSRADIALDAIDAAATRGPIENRIPAEIEEVAKLEFQAESLAICGNVWDWSNACDEVRNRYRLRAFLDVYSRLMS